MDHLPLADASRFSFAHAHVQSLRLLHWCVPKGMRTRCMCILSPCFWHLVCRQLWTMVGGPYLLLVELTLLCSSYCGMLGDVDTPWDEHYMNSL